jgi:hypothetical protein
VTEKPRLLGPPLARGRPFKWLHYVTEPRAITEVPAATIRWP